MKKKLMFTGILVLTFGTVFTITYNSTLKQIAHSTRQEQIRQLILHRPDLLNIESVTVMPPKEYEEWLKNNQEHNKKDLEPNQYGYKYGTTKTKLKNKLIVNY